MEIKKSFSKELYEAIYPVALDQDGMRLDQFIQKYLPSFSREQIKEKIKKGDIKIEGRPHPHKPSTKIYYNEKIQIKTEVGNLEDEFWRGEKIDLQDLEIIYEDQKIIAISKPPFMSTHPTGRHLFYCATVHLEEKYGHTIHSIHRIDRETSGLLLLGKNPEAASHISKLFEEDKIHKCYFFISKIISHPSFPLKAKERLGVKENFIPRTFNHSFPENSLFGKEAETLFYEIYRENDYFFGLAFPKTGRQHQIRSHAAHHGFPLLGDKLYNGDPTIFMRFKDGNPTKEDHDKMEITRHALHAIGIKFEYNGDQNFLLRTEIPSDFKAWYLERGFNLHFNELEKKVKDKITEIL